MRGKPKDLSGQQFGQLTAIERVGTKRSCALWKCVCICGEEVEVTSRDLNSGNTRSCGCGYKHGGYNATHQMCETPEYKAWRRLSSRGLLPSEWSSFADFLSAVGYKPNPQCRLTRKDNRIPHSNSNTYWRNPNDSDTDKGEATYGFIDLDTGTYGIAGETEEA